MKKASRPWTALRGNRSSPIRRRQGTRPRRRRSVGDRSWTPRSFHPPWQPQYSGSAEREAKGLRSGIQKLDLEQAVVDGLGLTDELVEPRLRQRPVPLGVDV